MSHSADTPERHVLIIAGEASGDLHGANLIRSVRERCPALHCVGVGGERMRSAGCQLLFSSDELSVMGISEVLTRLPKILGRLRQLRRRLKEQPPDLLVLIDFPDFNLRLAETAHRYSIPVLYYICPKVWAWRRGRAARIARLSDRLALIFPFEPDIYRPYGVSAEYVGNPLLDELADHPPRGDLRQRYGLGSGRPIVGLFPGSRTSELKYIFDSLLDTARELRRRKPDVCYILPVAPSLSIDWFRSRLADEDLPVTLVEKSIYEVAVACDAVLSVSGTVTLQLALMGTPMAVLYRVAPLSYAIGKRLIRIEHVSLVNIVGERRIVQEFLQDAAEPQAMCDELVRLLDDPEYRRKMLQGLDEVRLRMGEAGCSERVAGMVCTMTG